MNRNLLLVAALVAAMLTGGCVSPEARLQQRYAEGLRPYTELGLERARFTRVWEQNLNLAAYDVRPAPKPRIRNVWLYEDTLLAAGSDGVIHAFDRRTGAVLWLVDLPTLPGHRPYQVDGAFYGVTGNRFFSISRTGALELGARFPFSLSAPLVATDEYVFAASGAGEVRKLSITTLGEIWPGPAAFAGAVVVEPVGMGPYLIVASTAGEIEALDMITSGRQTRFRARDSISGIAVDADHIYAGSRDYYTYCITPGGTVRWRTIIGAAVVGAPLLSGDALYVETLGRGATALTRGRGEILWQNPGATKILSSGGGYVFARSSQDELWLIDAESGETLQRLYIGDFDLMPRNTFDDGLVYLVTDQGRLVCLRAL